MTAKDFQKACEEALGDWLWDESFSRLHTERVSLGVVEMREIANALRKAEGKAIGHMKENDEYNRAKDGAIINKV